MDHGKRRTYKSSRYQISIHLSQLNGRSNTSKRQRLRRNYKDIAQFCSEHHVAEYSVVNRGFILILTFSLSNESPNLSMMRTSFLKMSCIFSIVFQSLELVRLGILSLLKFKTHCYSKI